MTTYAIPQTVPDDCDYLTAGKRYQCRDMGFGRLLIHDDNNDFRICLWNECPHLNGGNWTRVEGDEE